MASWPAAIPGGPPRWSGKHPKPRRGIATGASSCLWSTVGLTSTACQAPRRISYRKTSRQYHEQLREPRAVSITILFVLAPIGAIVAWWLSQQRLTAKPWLEVGAIGEVPGTGALSSPAATIGLGVFLAVVSSLFALFTSAYFMRMQVADWAQMPAPKVLWFNTGVLILSSVALQYAQVAARRGRMEGVADGLIAGGLFAFTFLVGQFFAWQQLNAAGYFLATNPANAFFYLLTGLHGLHLLGGLVALVLTIDKVSRGSELTEVRLSVELCAIGARQAVPVPKCALLR